MNERSRQLRRDIIKLSKANGGYHYGGTFSCVEILIALYDNFIKNGIDRFILSKGHACWGLYVLLMERGFNPSLEGHPHLDVANGIDWTTGSEGHGFPAGVGMALARKMLDKIGHVYVLVGDGECQEGTTWESMLMAVRHNLNNLTVIVDANETQGSGFVKDILPIPNLHRIANEIGWIAHEVDGHDVPKLVDLLPLTYKTAPHMIIAHTVKGKGVSFMEGRPEWHARWPNEEEVAAMLKELGA